MSILSQIRSRFLAVLLATVLLVCVGCGRKDKEAPKDDNESFDVKAVEGSRQALLSVTANVPRLLKEFEARAPKEAAGDASLLMAKTLLGQIGVEEVHVLLLWPQGGSLTPVIVLPDSTGKVWDGLKSDEFSLFFDKVDDKTLRPKAKTLEDAKSLPGAAKNVIVRSMNGQVVAAEPAVLARIEKGEWSPQKELAFQIAQQNKLSDYLVSVGFAFPKTLPSTLEGLISAEDKATGGPPAQMILGTLSSLNEQIQKWAASTEALAVSFQFKGHDGRQLKVAQQFVSAEAAKNAKSLIGQSSNSNTRPEGIVGGLLTTINSAKVERKLESGEKALHLTLSWNAADDQALAMQLGQAVMSDLMGASMQAGVSPTEGPIIARYESSPNLQADIDKEAIEKQLTKELARRIYPSWKFSGNTMSLELDPIVIPNIGMQDFESTTMISVTSVTTKDGKDVAVKAPAQELRSHHERYLASNSIEIKVKEGVKGETLQQATLKFDIPIPNVLHMFTLQADDVGKTQKDGGASLTLNTLARDTASGVYKGFTADERNQIHFFAKDASGRWLAHSMWSGGGNNWMARFAGEIDELMIVMTDDKPVMVSPTVTVSLNGGERIDMPSEPEVGVPSRYTISDYREHQSTDESALDGLKVTLDKSARRGPPSLALTLPPTATAAESRWEVNTFGTDSSAFISGHAFGGFDRVDQHWQSNEEDALDKADAIFGIARVVIPTDIETAIFEKQADGQWIPHELAGGTKIEAMIDKQIVTLSLADATVLGMRVMDDTGESLKSGRTDQDDEGHHRMFFWGYPTRVELHVAARIIDRRFPFEFIEGKIDETKLVAFKTEVADRRAVATELLRIQELLSQRSGQLDDIAGLHFFHDENGKPAHSIPLEVAQACPQSAERFGYTANPFHGYYFNLFEEQTSGDKTGPFSRASSARKQKWDKGEVEFKPYWGQPPSAYAWPQQKERPVLTTQWQQVYEKNVDGANLKVQPQRFEDWREINPLDEQPLFEQFRNY